MMVRIPNRKGCRGIVKPFPEFAGNGADVVLAWRRYYVSRGMGAITP
jgi:hypothetical protein